MRTFEVLMLLFLLPPAAGLLGHRPQRWLRLCWALALAAFVIHVFHEGPHWQLLPLYCAVFIVPVFLFSNSSSRPGLARLAGATCLLLALASAGLAYTLPMFRLPNPTGRFAVGTTVLHLVDKSRTEIHATPPRGPRELMVQIWYPTADTKAPLAPYRRWRETTLLSSYMAVLKTHSHLDAAVAHTSTPFHVLLFSPAWKNSRTQSTYQMEDLASHGFVVAAIDYPYNSQPVAFPDGRVIFSNDVRDIDDLGDYTLKDALAYANAEADYEAQDDSFVLDQLALMNAQAGNRFYGALDTSHAGAFGHSFGGGVAMQTALRDSRVLGAINMDGWTFGDVAQAGLAKPLMLMYEPYGLPSAAQLHSTNPAARRIAEMNYRDIHSMSTDLGTYGGYQLHISNAEHMNFSDRPLYSPLRHLSEAGAIPAARAHLIIETYTLAFFSKLLKGAPEPILSTVPSPFPEVKFEVWPGH